MNLSLRPFARSRRLRAMGVLAWLMLVVHSLAAAPMGMPGAIHAHAEHTGVASVEGHCHSMAASCCDHRVDRGDAGFDCHGDCADMCSGVLPPSAISVPVAMTMRPTHAMPLRIAAPSLSSIPPLRPPLT